VCTAVPTVFPIIHEDFHVSIGRIQSIDHYRGAVDGRGGGFRAAGRRSHRGGYTNNTPHPRGPIEWWMGDSRGHWESDTLVVDNVHFNDQTWFDEAGNFHSEALHVVERYTLIDPDHINYEATIEDPKVFTKPWKISLVLYRHKEKNFQLLDYECYAFGDDQYYP
jgi:hypothetical protein